MITRAITKQYVERLFERFSEIYGEKWTALFKNAGEYNLGKGIWVSALYSVSSEEIKKVLNLILTNQIVSIPSAQDFYLYAKGYKKTPESHLNNSPRDIIDNPRLSKVYLDSMKSIREKLGMPPSPYLTSVDALV